MNWILFEEITDYMENHLTQISITGLSEEFHFQEDYFNRLIKNTDRAYLYGILTASAPAPR